MDDTLQAKDFKPHIGKNFRFKGTRFVFPLVQVQADRRKLPDYVRRRPFTLIFRGPKEDEVLPEGLYDCEADGGAAYSLYLIPIYTPTPGRQDYQAVFS
jgi:hypothetical protein